MASHLVTFVLYVSLVIVQVHGTGIADLSFGGDGWRGQDIDDDNYKYEFSSGFQGDLCNSCSTGWSLFKSWQKTCWMPQGISYADGYIVRAFYQKEPGECATYSNAKYVAVSVVTQQANPTYSNILIDLDAACHAGDVVLTDIDGEYWFMVACSSWIAIFSEQSIQSISGKTISGKKFYYYVSTEDVMVSSLSGVSFSYLSKNHGHDNEYYAGRFDADSSSTDGLNLKLISIDPDNDWQISVLTSFEVTSSVAKQVQGATRIADSMILTGGTASGGIFIRQCTMDNDVINNCYEQCEIPWFCLFSGNLVLQGAETDDDGNLYVGSEMGACVDEPFYQLADLSGSQCVGLATSSWAQYIDYQGDPNVLIAVFALFVFTVMITCVNCVVYARRNIRQYTYQAVKVMDVSTDDEI